VSRIRSSLPGVLQRMANFGFGTLALCRLIEYRLAYIARHPVAHAALVTDHRRESISEIMEANYTYNLSLKELARLTHLSLASFKREFKKAFGTTPGKWLKEKRLDHAGRILSSSSKSISDVAFESGFENTTHFSRVFKEKFHETPLHYRQLIVADPVDF